MHPVPCTGTVKAKQHTHQVKGGTDALPNTEPDYSTLQFLQWYVVEQHQEEFLFKSILDKIQLIGTEGQGLFIIDREIGALGATKEKRVPSTSMQ
jgi:ferritin